MTDACDIKSFTNIEVLRAIQAGHFNEVFILRQKYNFSLSFLVMGNICAILLLVDFGLNVMNIA